MALAVPHVHVRREILPGRCDLESDLYLARPLPGVTDPETLAGWRAFADEHRAAVGGLHRILDDVALVVPVGGAELFGSGVTINLDPAVSRNAGLWMILVCIRAWL